MWGRLWMCQQCGSLCCAHGHKHQSWWSRSVWSCICHIHYPGKKSHCSHIHVQLSNKHSSKTYCNVIIIRKRLCIQTHQLIQKMSNARLIDCLQSSSKLCIISLPPLLGRVHPISMDYLICSWCRTNILPVCFFYPSPSLLPFSTKLGLWRLQAHGVPITVGNVIVVALTATLAAIGSASIPNSALVSMITVLQVKFSLSQSLQDWFV